MPRPVISETAMGLSEVATKPRDERLEDNTNGFQLHGLNSEVEKRLVRKLDRSILLIVAILCMRSFTTCMTQVKTTDNAADTT